MTPGDVLLVTGGSRGIGAAVARRAAADGWRVCLTYREDEAAAAAVVGWIEAANGTARAIRADVRDEADVVAAFDAAASLGPLRAVVANAGIAASRSLLADMTVERIREVVDVNVVGTLLTCREAVRRLDAGGGSIVIVSSVATSTGSPGEYVDYAAAKGALDVLGHGLAREVAARSIRVNVVRPGTTDTDIHARNGQPDRAARVAKVVPLGRVGTPEEVAAAVLWLTSDDAGYCTGTVVDVAGGLG